MKLRLIRSDKTDLLEQHESSLPLCSLTLDKLVVNYDSLFSLECEQLNLKGNVIGVIGHNGAGKSTLIKSVLDLLPIRQGKISTKYLSEKKESKLLPEKDMAFCPETGSVFADISVENYIKLWCRIKQRDEKYYLKSGAIYIDKLNLVPLLPKLGRELSKGQRRRVQTAIGFLTSPKLFIFDEPFDGLDVQKTHELTDIISEHSHNMTFMITSHRMDVMERLSDALIVLKEGRIISTGSVEEVTQQLAGITIRISNMASPDSIINELRLEKPDLLINKIGSDLCITGKNLYKDGLSILLSRHGIRDLKLEEDAPSLVEAMNYHLRAIR